jgi:hypothetical protein
VNFENYVFPGGDGFSLDTNGGTAPVGGSKYTPEITPDNATGEATQKKLQLSLEDPLYFLYTYSAGGTGTNAAASVIAQANFKTGGNTHTVFQTVQVSSTSQEVIITPTVTQNEFE